MDKYRIRIVENFTERTLAVSNYMDWGDALRFREDFRKYFHHADIVDVDVLIEAKFE